MKTNTAENSIVTEVWVPIPRLAGCIRCSANYLHVHGRAGNFGYRQVGPKKFEVNLHEAVDYYTAEFPNILLDHRAIEALTNHTE